MGYFETVVVAVRDFVADCSWDELIVVSDVGVRVLEAAEDGVSDEFRESVDVLVTVTSNVRVELIESVMLSESVVLTAKLTECVELKEPETTLEYDSEIVPLSVVVADRDNVTDFDCDIDVDKDTGKDSE